MKLSLPLLLVSTLYLLPAPALAKSCAFSEHSDKITGSPVDQARCLVRRVLPGGILSTRPAELTPFFESILGRPVSISRQELAQYLRANQISDREVGGSVFNRVSKTWSGASASHFVIHDTADAIRAEAFPFTINDARYAINRLDNRAVGMAHVMINRVGESRTGNDYSRSLKATKFERRNFFSYGSFLHHEMVQPRIRGRWAYHAVSPEIGFTTPQLRRLALLYVTASVRRGTWLIPAFHAALDQGIPNGHDDPQNFDLDQWMSLVERVAAEVNGGRLAPVSEPVRPQPRREEVVVQQPRPVVVQRPAPVAPPRPVAEPAPQHAPKRVPVMPAAASKPRASQQKRPAKRRPNKPTETFNPFNQLNSYAR